MMSSGILVHNALGRAFKQTLASPAELQRLKQVVQDHADQVAQAEIDGAAVSDPAAFRALRGKRMMGVNEWLDTRDSIPTLLSFLVGSVAVDKLFSTFFECEEFAKDKGWRRSRDDVAGDDAGEDLRGRTGLLQSLVNETGILHQVHVMMCEPLFSADSPLLMLNRSFAGRGARISRGMQLRLSASFRHRFLGTFWSEELAIIRILDEELELQLQRLEVLVVPGGECLKYKGSFIHRLRDRLTAAPVLTPEEMLTVVLGILDAVAEDPLICSMHDVELLHAASRQP